MGSALTVPAIYALLSSWCPFNERTVTIGGIWTGMSFGNAIGTVLAGTIAEKNGKKVVIIRMACSFLYIWIVSINLVCLVDIVENKLINRLGSSSPSEYKSISAEEFQYIQDNTKLVIDEEVAIVVPNEKNGKRSDSI